MIKSACGLDSTSSVDGVTAAPAEPNIPMGVGPLRHRVEEPKQPLRPARQLGPWPLIRLALVGLALVLSAGCTAQDSTPKLSVEQTDRANAERLGRKLAVEISGRLGPFPNPSTWTEATVDSCLGAARGLTDPEDKPRVQRFAEWCGIAAIDEMFPEP